MADCPFERMVLVENRLGGFWEEPGVLGGCTSSAVCAHPTPKPQAPWIMDKICSFVCWVLQDFLSFLLGSTSGKWKPDVTG